jgi:hypothetical protein
VVEEVLAERVDLPDALLLKAQILWEGYGETFEPKQYCRRVMDLVADAEAPVHRRAAALLRRLRRAAPLEQTPLSRRRLTR